MGTAEGRPGSTESGAVGMITATDLRIYFVGAHSTGKTTLARHVAKKFDLPMLSEVARGVLAELETTLDRVHVDIDLCDEFQGTIFHRQIEQESEQERGFVSDRAFDNVAYAAMFSRISHELTSNEDFAAYMEQLRRPGRIVFYVRPHKRLLRADGVRTDLDWQSVCRLDGAIMLLLEAYGVPYFTVADYSMRDRVRLVDGIIRLAANFFRGMAEESIKRNP